MSEELTFQIGQWMNNWKINYTSLSKMSATIDIYEMILKDEFTDTDHWYGNGGSDVNYRLSKFTHNDWQHLKEDLINWKDNQLEILSLILTTSDDYFTIEDIKAFKSYKSECFLFILTICNDDQFIDLISEIHFIKLHENRNLEQLQTVYSRLASLEHAPVVENEKSNEYYYTRKSYNEFVEIINTAIQQITG